MFISVGLLLMYVSSPFVVMSKQKLMNYFGYCGFCFGLALTLLWMTVMSFDLWRNIK